MFLDKVIDVQGCVVPDENFRTCRRDDAWNKALSGGQFKNKPIQCQRKSTDAVKYIIPDAMSAYMLLVKNEGSAEDIVHASHDIVHDIVNDDENNDDNASNMSDNDYNYINLDLNEE